MFSMRCICSKFFILYEICILVSLSILVAQRQSGGPLVRRQNQGKERDGRREMEGERWKERDGRSGKQTDKIPFP